MLVIESLSRDRTGKSEDLYVSSGAPGIMLSGHLHNTSVLYLFRQRRGLDDKKLLPYFPYRDDGEQILEVIENMVKEYVDL